MKSLLIAILLFPLFLCGQGMRPAFVGAAEQQKITRGYTVTYVAQADYKNDGTSTNQLWLRITNSAQGFTALSVMSRNSHPVTSVTNSLGDTWTRNVALTNASNRYLFGYYCTNTTSGSNVIIVTLDAAVTYIGARAYHFTGVQLSGPLDQQTTASGTGGAQPYVVSSGSITPGANGELVIGAAIVDVGNLDADTSNGWVLPAGYNFTYPGLHYAIQTTAGAITSFMTNNTSSDLYDAVVTSYKHR
jgi:hypothetical protein